MRTARAGGRYRDRERVREREREWVREREREREKERERPVLRRSKRRGLLSRASSTEVQH